MCDFSLSACTLRLLRLRIKNKPRRSEMRTSPPITPPMIAPVGFLSMVVEEPDVPTFGVELDELDDGTLVEVGALLEELEEVEDAVPS